LTKKYHILEVIDGFW